DARSRSLEDLRHIVILMQENRSFDHYFGTLAGVRGFGDRFPIPAAPLPGVLARSAWLQAAEGDGHAIAPFALDTVTDFRYMRVEGTPHTWLDAQAAWDHGRMGRWPDAKRNHSLGYYRRADIPFQFALADTFTLCDAYHCAIQSSTNPNRVFLWTGHNDAAARNGGPVLGNSHDNFPDLGGHAASYSWPSYVERLQQAGISWQVYQDMADNYTNNPLAGFESFRQARQGAAGSDARLAARGASTRDLAQLRRDVLEGRLPQVSYVVADAAGSEHPERSSPAQGAAYTARVLDALTADPAVWSRTALLVMFDENDGFFDHAPPPAPPSLDPQAPGGLAGGSAVSTAGEYHLQAPPGDERFDDPAFRGRPYGLGARVPMYIISPWSRGGWVDSQVYDHTSVLRLLERRFGVTADISAWRRAVCGDLTGAFDFASADARPFIASLPPTAAAAGRAAALPVRATPPAPAAVQAPVQDSGVRRSRALPYRPAVRLTTDAGAGTVRLALASEGAAAVLQIYDRLRPAAIPRRYTVAPGQPLAGDWSVHEGRYDLWLLGPNGFHRHYTGRVDAQPVESRVEPAADGSPRIRLVLRNPGPAAIELRLRPGAYANPALPVTLQLAAGAEHSLQWPLAMTSGWYDLWIESAGGSQRLAGRVETGADSTSDPAMGGPARLWQEEAGA
ncbi:MAG: phospholipase C, phosphocholine-specific, partial [Steroidobacteraceae bacterium]